jgi:hypothetical protein
LTINSRFKYNGKIKLGRKPSKKQMKMQGKTVYGGSSSNFGKSVWKKKIIKVGGIKQTIYILHKCNSKKDCDGYYIYDERNYKVCNICGGSLNYDNNVKSIISTKEIQNNYNQNMYNTKPIESISTRNRFWDILDMDNFIYDKDKGADKLKDRYKNIREFEKNLKKKVVI